MKPYPKYKCSGVEWLGDVPEIWSRKKFKLVANIKKGILPKKITLDNIGFPPYLSMNYLRGSFASEFVKDESAHIVEYGEILLLWDGANAGEFIQAKYGVISSTIAHIVFIKDINKKYAWYYSKFLEQQLRKTTIGMGIPHVSGNELNNLIFCEPSIFEQKTIANFLDRETTHIDSLIKEKENFISLLKEKRQALISHAVTKGLDPSVKVKGSGIEWVGDTPDHWGISMIRYIGRCQNGINIGAEHFGHGFPFVSYGDVYKHYTLPINGSGLVNSSVSDRKSYSVQNNDIFFTRTSETIEEIGFSSVCENEIKNACFAGFLIRFRPQKDILFSGFSKYYFRNEKLRAFFVKEMNLITRASLSQDLLKKMPVLLPSLSEQKSIATYLDKQTTKIDLLVKETKTSIELLKEHRTALISAAVTGKIDVRNFEKEVA